MPFPVADLFFELNHSADDLGIHAEIDGDAWTGLEIEGPGNRKLLSIVSKGRLRNQGLTQLAFESAEPSFSDLDPAEFFGRFPEGAYNIEASQLEGGKLKSTVHLSHVLAAPPDNITVAGRPAAASCEQPLPEVRTPVLIRWSPVTRSHPTIGKTGPVEISRYQFFVELPGGKLSIDLPPTTTEYLGDEDATLREEVVYALDKIGGPTAIALLQHALRDRQDLVREAAADILAELEAKQRKRPAR
jgi:HEAT repeat protein